MAELVPHDSHNALPAVERLNAEDARALTDEIKSDVKALRVKLLRAYEGEAHIALGYTSWKAYWVAEFETHWVTGYRELDAARVDRVISPWANEPLPERQARPLAKLLRKEGEDAVVEVVRRLQAEYPHGTVTEKTVHYAVHEYIHREREREQRRRGTGQLELLEVDVQAAPEWGEPLADIATGTDEPLADPKARQPRPPDPAVYVGLAPAYTCPKCKCDWGRAKRPQEVLVVVSESDANERHERDLAFAQTSVIGRIDMLADDLRELVVGRSTSPETLGDIWVALGYLREQMTRASHWARLVSVREDDEEGA